jgi:hypothetical protein
MSMATCRKRSIQAYDELDALAGLDKTAPLDLNITISLLLNLRRQKLYDTLIDPSY